MAAKEIDNSLYQALKADLSEGIPVSTLAPKYKLGERRVRQIRDSKSYKGYLQKRANERRQRAQNTPAKAVAGEHDLAQENQEFMAETENGSVPADQAAPTKDGERDIRTDEQKAEAEAIKRRARKARLDREAERAKKFGQVFTIVVLILAAVGFVAVLYGFAALLRNL